jgi:hypothetical protein
MKYLKYSIICIIVIILTLSYNCEKKHVPLIIEKFPLDVGNSWEYIRTFYTNIYDTINNDTTESMYTLSFSKVIVDIDTMMGWKCWELKETQIYADDTFPETHWYAHPDTALLKVANCIEWLPKLMDSKEAKFPLKFKIGDSYFDSTIDIIGYIRHIKYFQNKYSESDTVYYLPPRKLFIYPLEVGKSWTVFNNTQDEFSEEREVIEEQFINTNVGIFATFKIELTCSWGIDRYKWIAKEGLIKDSIYVRSEVVRRDTSESGFIVVGYNDIYDVYKLIDYELVQ